MTTKNTKTMNRREFLRGGRISEELEGCLFVLGVGTLGLSAISLLIYFNKDNDKPINSSIGVRNQPVDQVFRDHDGYRVYYSDQSGRVVETKYFESNRQKLDGQLNPNEFVKRQFSDLGTLVEKHTIKVFSDLDEGTRGYVRVLDFSTMGHENCDYVEIHLSKNSRLAPGNETYGGKFNIQSQMGEIDNKSIGKKPAEKK
jgi:hypothetical protein